MVVDPEAEAACDATQQCTAAFDILVKSTQFGILSFSFVDYKRFCLYVELTSSRAVDCLLYTSDAADE